MPNNETITPGFRQGLFIVITGNGKGKTTAAFGQALRAAGHGLRVVIIQFMKGRAYGEILALQRYMPQIRLFQYGRDNFVKRDNPAPMDIEVAGQGMQKAREIISSGECDLLILDEINVAADYNLVTEDEILELINSRPGQMDLLFTGRYASDKIIALADTVSEISAVKHHYDSGINNRVGIEY